MGIGRWFQEKVFDNIIKPVVHALDVALNPVEDFLQGNIWDKVREEVREEVYDIKGADSTTKIIQAHGNRPVTDAPVRHIISIDGTGVDGGGTIHDLYNSVAPVGADGMVQHASYHRGSGTNHSGLGHVFNQASGADIPNGILQVCRELTRNFQAGDEIILKRFSRAGFEALSVAGFIDKVGLIIADDMSNAEIDRATAEALDLYLSNASECKIQAFKEKYPVHEPPKINIALIDPVATRLPNHDHHVLDAGNVENVFVAYALDEDANFLKQMRLEHLPNVTAMHFIGDHSVLGGTKSGLEPLSAIPARWLADNLSQASNTSYDPVAFNTLIAQPDALLPVRGEFGNDSLPMALGGYSVSILPEGAQIDPSVELRRERVENYNPQQLQLMGEQTTVLPDASQDAMNDDVFILSANGWR